MKLKTDEEKVCLLRMRIDASLARDKQFLAVNKIEARWLVYNLFLLRQNSYIVW